MTVSELIKRKNQIIYDEFGVVLVPDNQIEECEQVPLSLESIANACPYCKIYCHIGFSCNNCPMNVKGNKCGNNDSSWHMFVKEFNKKHSSRYITEWYQSSPEMVALYEQYNNELKE